MAKMSEELQEKYFERLAEGRVPSSAAKIAGSNIFDLIETRHEDKEFRAREALMMRQVMLDSEYAAGTAGDVEAQKKMLARVRGTNPLAMELARDLRRLVGFKVDIAD